MRHIEIVRRHRASTAVGLALASLAYTMVAVSSASASGFGISDQSTVGTGEAYAGVAAGGTLSDQFWNPATLGDVKGFQTESDLSLILPILNVNTNAIPFGGIPAQSQGSIGIAAAVPASNFAYRVNPNIILGLGITSPFGLATGFSGSSVLVNNRFGTLGTPLGIGLTSRIFSIDVNPNVAYQFNDQFTIAVGLQAQYMNASESGFLTQSGILSGQTKNLGYGFTLGADYKPVKGTSIGFGYRSGITNTLNGSISGVQPVSVGGNLTLKTPGTATIGISQDFGDFWTLKAGVVYTNWSVLKNAALSGAAGLVVQGAIGQASLPFNYRDTWMPSLGAEYKYSKDLTLRAGIAYESSPITAATRNFRLPDTDRLWLSTGLSYAVTKQVSFDLGYSFLYGLGSGTINPTVTALTPAGGGPVINGPFSGTISGTSHILSAALKVKFD